MSQQTENYNFNLIETTDKITDSLNDLNDNFEALDEILSSISAISFEIVQTLPVTGESGIIYLVPNSGSGENVYDEYIWINNAFELIGSTAIDLSGYEQIANKVTSISSSSTNSQYPGAKLVYDSLLLKQNKVTASTTDLVAGTSQLATGEIYVVYE